VTLAERITTALDRVSPAEMLAGDLVDSGPGEALRQAAVLIAITDRAEPGVILTERPATMRLHPGQIAFPGGRIDDGERPRAAALREAWEELRLDPESVRLLGEADHYRTITGFGVTPVVAMIPADPVLTANPAEVESWFEAPLGFLLDPANQRRRSGVYRGRERHYFEIMWGERRIWGATAAMLVNLGRRLG
jgi:8-oxo-dGTP pyrophosphatase MutT (NUDIX family)